MPHVLAGAVCVCVGGLQCHEPTFNTCEYMGKQENPF